MERGLPAVVVRVVFDALDALQSEGLIDGYVLGGATALLYYSEPTFTEDIDVFIGMQSTQALTDVSPIYRFLAQRGAVQSDEYLLIGGFPVQILLPYDELSEEAFRNARSVEISGKEVKIFGLEYLIAIMLQLAKPKYRERIRILLEEHSFDEARLTEILARHGLLVRWKEWRKTLS